MLVFSAIGLVGFLLLLIVWLWILPDNEGASKGKWLLAVALALTAIGILGTILAKADTING